MPFQPIIPTFTALNASNDVSPSHYVDVRTGVPLFAGGLAAGDYFDLTEKEANALSYTPNGLLHAGRYRRVQVSPLATAANLGIGKLAFMPTLIIPELNIVTSQDLGVVAAGTQSPGRIVVMLNVITPGNYGFVQELGVANVSVNAAAAIGASINIGTVGNAAPGGATPTTPSIGTSLSTLGAAGMGLVLLNLDVVQG